MFIIDSFLNLLKKNNPAHIDCQMVQSLMCVIVNYISWRFFSITLSLAVLSLTLIQYESIENCV